MQHPVNGVFAQASNWLCVWMTLCLKEHLNNIRYCFCYANVVDKYNKLNNYMHVHTSIEYAFTCIVNRPKLDLNLPSLSIEIYHSNKLLPLCCNVVRLVKSSAILWLGLIRLLLFCSGFILVSSIVMVSISNFKLGIEVRIRISWQH
jgi:hypothetical protein